MSLSLFDSFFDPFSEFEMLCILSSVNSKLEILLALPELFGSGSEYFSSFSNYFFLVLIIIVRVVGFIECRVSVLVDKIFGKIIVFEMELSAGGFGVVVRAET